MNTLLKILLAFGLLYFVWHLGRWYEYKQFPQCLDDLECWCEQAGGLARYNFVDTGEAGYGVFVCIAVEGGSDVQEI